MPDITEYMSTHPYSPSTRMCGIQDDTNHVSVDGAIKTHNAPDSIPRHPFMKRFHKILGFYMFTLSLLLLLFGADSGIAREWFVRPADGSYGREDGSDYQNAFKGPLSLKWGPNGIQPGDTLWICGVHIYDITDRYSYSKRLVPLPSGTSEARRIILRGDFPGDPGVLWGAGRLLYDTWKKEGGGVWSIPLMGTVYAGDWLFQVDDPPGSGSHVVLEKAASREELLRTPGAHYSPTYTPASRLYVHTTDGKAPGGRILVNWWGYAFAYDRLAHVTFQNVSFFNPGRIPRNARLSHVRWQGCDLRYGMHALLGFWGDNRYIEVIDCQLSWAANGIYNSQPFWQEGKVIINQTCRNYLYKGNYIHHIGVRRINQNKDAHAIGIQGGYDGLIEGNVIDNCGSGIVLYAYTEQELKDTIVRKNIVRNLHKRGGATGYGIATMCNNDSFSDKTGNRFYQNLIINAPVGMRFQFESDQAVYNNIFYNCDIGLESTRNYNGRGARVTAMNNLFLYSTSYHVRWGSGARNYMVHFNHNLFFPADSRKFKLGAKALSFSQWRSLVQPGSLFDRQSIVAKPLFASHPETRTGAEDFKPGSGSPSVDTGVDVGLDSDFFGMPMVNLPDIGAIEWRN